jgi:hypothetical protein
MQLLPYICHTVELYHYLWVVFLITQTFPNCPEEEIMCLLILFQVHVQPAACFAVVVTGFQLTGFHCPINLGS